MELSSDEANRLKRLLDEWTDHKEHELEATFSGASDKTTFLAVAQRLKARGFEALPQEDKLNIIVPDPISIRFTLTGMAQIEAYCNDNRLDGKYFEVMRKNRAGVESNVDINEYGLRVKVRREELMSPTDPAVQQLLKTWSSQPKAFRLMRRYTFLSVEKGVRFDLSMVRSTSRILRGDKKGQFDYKLNFQDEDLGNRRAEYELEVELLRPTAEDKLGKTKQQIVDNKLKQLIAGIGEVLRGIQKHHLLIRKSVSQRVLSQYADLINVPFVPGKPPPFRGVAPYGMIKENMTKQRRDGVPNVRDGYNVTDKADGLRMMGFVDDGGELFMIDMSMSVYRTGLTRLALSNSLVDGEYVTRDVDNNPITQFLLFDIYIAPNKQDVTTLGFIPQEGEGRLKALQEWSKAWNEGSGPERGFGVTDRTKITVQAKKFLDAKPGDRAIFQACGKMLVSVSDTYHTDGLILTPNLEPIPQKPGVTWNSQLKWKPASQNTVDFLVLLDKDVDTGDDKVITGVKPGASQANVRYKTMNLYVGSENDPAHINPRSEILRLLEGGLPGGKRSYKRVPFTPLEYADTMANICYRECLVDPLTGDDVIECENGDPIADRTIVECRYDLSEMAGWRWKPILVRHDKTERFERGLKGRIMNNDKTAEGVWNSIHDPITYHMITTGSEIPSPSELEELMRSGENAEGVVGEAVSKVYYDRKAPKDDSKIIKGLRDFHRLYIKDRILLGSGLRGGGKTLVDLACGQGGDMNTWWDSKCDFVYGTDIAGDGITNPKSGIYRRYLNLLMRSAGQVEGAIFEKGPKMIFTIGTSAENLANGDAGATSEEKNIMRAVYGKIAPDGPVPPYIERYGMNRLRNGADCVAIMFAIHYFFENESTLANFIQNVSDSLAVGGLFVGCCFDGETVFNKLREKGVTQGGSLVGQEAGGAEIWKITKQYSDEEEFTQESLGLPIDVQFMSIGTEQREYLVPFELLKQKMREIGCDLLTEAECREIGLQNSTNMFAETYKMATRAGLKYPMSAKVQEYSFFNRWFIFKRKRGGVLPATEAELAAEEAPLAPEPSMAEARSLVFQTPAERAVVAQGEALVSAAPTKAKAGVKGKAPESTVVPATAQKLFALNQVFNFSSDAIPSDKQLGIGDPNAARWLSPFAPVTVIDRETSDEYPSIEHFLGAMKYKMATDKPELAPLIFGKAGTIRQKYAGQKMTETKQGTQALTEAREEELLKLERAEILEESGPKGLKKYKATFNPARWDTLLNQVLEDAYRQRWQKDGQLRKIVQAVIAKKLHLVYTEKGIPGLFGRRTADKRIEGENRVGELLMRLATE